MLQARQVPDYPDRVIDVGSSSGKEAIRVHESSPGEKGHYLALSYRWGKDPIKLLEANVKTFKNALPIQSLPPVIRDAIKVTQILGIRYLWVDALCIIQDCTAEWESEVQSMDQIYRQALLTIAANVDSSDEEPGLFRKRGNNESNTRSAASGLRKAGILETRGWLLQEQVFSSRMLIFTENEVYWTCVGIDASVSQAAGIGVSLMGTTREGRVRQLQRYLNGIDRGLYLWKKNVYEIWLTLATEYSRRDLTNNSDRLAALSGIQSAIAASLEDECVAGL